MPHLSTKDNPYPLEPLEGNEMAGASYFFKEAAPGSHHGRVAAQTTFHAGQIDPQLFYAQPTSPQPFSLAGPYAASPYTPSHFVAPPYGTTPIDANTNVNTNSPSRWIDPELLPVPFDQPSFAPPVSANPQPVQPQFIQPAPVPAPAPALPPPNTPTTWSPRTVEVYNYQDTSRIREVSEFPIAREWEVDLRFPFRSNPLNSTNDLSRLASKVQIVGTIAPVKCGRCQAGPRPFPECVIMPVKRKNGGHFIAGVCANCYYSGHNQDCSFYRT